MVEVGDIRTVTTPDGEKHVGSVSAVTKQKSGSAFVEVFSLGTISRDPAVATIVCAKTGQNFTGELRD